MSDSREEPSFDEAETGHIRSALLEWYDRHRRDLPWRGIDNPYKTWVAEVMLQQTQVATVVDYYQRWLERFPTVADLAEAEREEVMEMWEGLGYYRRAKYLHESAKIVVRQFGGSIPSDSEALEELKGIGPYTAGAIASIAFGEPVPVVDGNVERVLSRLRAIGGDPKSTGNQKTYWRLASRLVAPERPGDFNQAMMELGATVCTPQAPACMLCPIRESCDGFDSGSPSNFPDVASRTRQKPVSVATSVVTASDGAATSHLVMRRPEDGLLGGLWEFPTVELGDSDEPRDAVDDFLAELGLPTSGTRSSLGTLEHHFSHIRMTLHVDRREVAGALAIQSDRPTRWVDADALDDIPMSTAMRKVQKLADIPDGE